MLRHDERTVRAAGGDHAGPRTAGEPDSRRVRGPAVPQGRHHADARANRVRGTPAQEHLTIQSR